MDRAPKPTERLAQRSGRLISAVLALGLVIPSLLFAADTYPIEIQGNFSGGERFEKAFTALIPDRPVRDSEYGYSPPAFKVDGEVFTAKYQTPLELTWNFGDGTSVTTGDHVSASHQYADDGTYTVSVVARDAVGEFARASRDITIVNNDPSNLRVAATVVDPSQNIVELSGWAEDVDGDPLQFKWDFGDGDSAEGSADEIWWTRHQYIAPGRYEVTLTVTDDDYPSASGSNERNDGRAVKTIKVTIGDGGVSPAAGADQPDAESAEATLTNRLGGATNGVVNSQFDGEVRPFAGLYLSQVDSGACRFMFSMWDNANLVHGLAVLDLNGVPPEGGRFRINRPQFLLEFQPDAETYLAVRKSRPDPFGDAGVAGLVQRTLDRATAPGGSALTDEQRLAVTDRLGDLAGIRSQPRIGNALEPPAVSPFVDQQVGFRTVAGSLVLDFIPGDRAVGHFDVTMEAGFGPLKGQTIQVTADLALDMEAAASDGIVRYEGCEPPPFEIKKTWPRDGAAHLFPKQPPVRIDFSDPVDPATLDAQSVQIAYTDASGTLVPVPIRIMRDDDSVHVVPQQPLLPGVTYALRVRTGVDGVRSRKGSPLDSGGEDDWFTSRFTTRVDMTPLTDGQRLLACQVYQPARDVPLIVGKPAVARVFANWEPQPGVHPDQQVQSFTGTVELYGPDSRLVGSQVFEFVRPDLWESRGIDIKAAEQSSQLAFTPTADMRGSLLLGIRVKYAPDADPEIQYRSICPVKLWDRQPSLSIDFVALPIDEWRHDPSLLQALMPALQRVADASVDYAMEQFPFAHITAGPVRVLSLGVPIPPLRPQHTPSFFKCVSTCILDGYPSALTEDLAQAGEPGFEGINDWLSSQSSADVIIAFGPHLRLLGGATSATLRNGRGVVLVLGGDDAGFFPRYVNGAVHEVGHVLDLQHLPYVVDDGERAIVLALREGNAFWYEGIEALRISRDGQTVWNKSSTDGNEQGARLFPLMFPGTIPTDEAFIANHHYRKIQKLLEELGR